MSISWAKSLCGKRHFFVDTFSPYSQHIRTVNWAGSRATRVLRGVWGSCDLFYRHPYLCDWILYLTLYWTSIFTPVEMSLFLSGVISILPVVYDNTVSPWGFRSMFEVRQHPFFFVWFLSNFCSVLSDFCSVSSDFCLIFAVFCLILLFFLFSNSKINL